MSVHYTASTKATLCTDLSLVGWPELRHTAVLAICCHVTFIADCKSIDRLQNDDDSEGNTSLRLTGCH
eukprot:3933819-Rhodomonas_salina.1